MSDFPEFHTIGISNAPITREPLLWLYQHSPARTMLGSNIDVKPYKQSYFKETTAFLEKCGRDKSHHSDPETNKAILRAVPSPGVTQHSFVTYDDHTLSMCCFNWNGLPWWILYIILSNHNNICFTHSRIMHPVSLKNDIKVSAGYILKSCLIFHRQFYLM